MAAVADEFSDRIIRMHGKVGETWLASLPGLIEHFARRWSLQPGSPLSPLTYSYILPVTGPEGIPLVLKLGLPNPELYSEIESLTIYAGRGAVRLYESDPDQGALLLARVIPGRGLVECPDDLEATRIACRVMARLWRPVPHGHNLPSIADWGRGFQRLRTYNAGGSGLFPAGMVDRAEEDYDQLLATMGEPVVLHGDLHHWNILSSDRAAWLAIDPKGVIGEREYEIGAWMRNPFPGLRRWQAPVPILQRRLDIFASELGLNRQRMKRWAFAQAVLSAWWSIEDGAGDAGPWISVANLLMAVR
jgi:streptomycin 6-kinase